MNTCHIGILQADSVLPQFQQIHGNYPGMIEAVLREAGARIGAELTFTTFDVQHGQYPDKVSSCDAYVITGSKMSVYDDEPWIRQLREYVVELNKARARLVGICFGHQMIAEALGGKTESADAGWGVGIQFSDVTSEKWFMSPPVESYSLLVSHKDQVTRLPEEAELLATSEFCPNSMFCIDDHILALQGHPEFVPAYARDLMVMREEILGPEKFETGMASLSFQLMAIDISEWIVRFVLGREQL